ncbi:pga2 [Hyphodiscus hymeniophilus]|uniref:Pga2 n=1 Tax=Hyphodiscus hymeniophilus TaxID=353542 RepID=A0A9P6VIK5_9HELO|nr:pga2 [Hyphodiscus hymeniophilus]
MEDIIGGASYVIENIQYFALNFLHNIENVLDMDLRTAIRLVVIVGAYLLIRPYLVKGGAKLQEKQHAKVYEADKKREKEALISANSLRGQVKVPEDTESEEEGQASGVNWGGKARKKQRKAIKKILEADEKMRLDAEGDQDDKDIMDLLVDYEEGKDGW